MAHQRIMLVLLVAKLLKDFPKNENNRKITEYPFGPLQKIYPYLTSSKFPAFHSAKIFRFSQIRPETSYFPKFCTLTSALSFLLTLTVHFQKPENIPLTVARSFDHLPGIRNQSGIG